jgi:putative transposase
MPRYLQKRPKTLVSTGFTIPKTFDGFIPFCMPPAPYLPPRQAPTARTELRSRGGRPSEPLADGVWALLRTDGWRVNRKRIERLWRAEGHRVPPRRSKASGKRAQGSADNASWNLPAIRPNHIWSYDFVSELTRSGGPIKILNVVDEFTRVSLCSYVARSIGSRDVRRHLERLFARHGKPELIRSDKGREFIATSLGDWLTEHGVATAFIEKGSPQQNPCIERFNGTMRDELLNGEEFDNLLEARVVIGAWNEEYNTRRPHRGLRMLTPAEFARRWKEGGA